ncbi:hypothetical protein N9L33_04320, partial [Nitrospinae bacterium]|nr:hypothetical protein [Nitrospinota bacterium]
LSFYQAGKYKRFEHCFQRVLESLNLDLNISLNNTLIKRFFRTASVLGFIEVDYTSPSMNWSLNPPSLLKSGEGYILISPPNVTNKFPALFDTFDDHIIDIFCENENLRKYCCVLLKKFKTITKEQKQELIRNNILTIDNIDGQIMSKLPKIEVVNKLCLTATKGQLLEFFNHAEIFDFDKFEWIATTSSDSGRMGLFRWKPEYGGRRYIIRHHNGIETIWADINSYEWAQMIAGFLLNKSLGTIYEHSKSIFSIPSRIELPTLINRLLANRSMTMAYFEKNKKMWVYSNINPLLVRKIYTLYPFLRKI